jgi:O-antigen ligase
MISSVIAFAALTGPLPKLGMVVVALFAAGTLLLPDPRRRALSMLGALVLSPVLLLSEIWHSSQLHVVHRHPLEAVVGAIVAVAALAYAARLIARHPAVLAPLIVVMLPFRVPIQAGGATANLLVPLYLVVGAGALASIVPALRGTSVSDQVDAAQDGRGGGGRDGSGGWAIWVHRLVAIYLVLYALQALYSPSFETALRQMVFFYVPFTLMYRLLREVSWTPQAIRNCLRLTLALAVAFALIAYVEYATKTIILNPKLVTANDLHTYFVVNSVFFDPDIFGRYLALAMILVAVLLLYPRSQRETVLVIVVLAVLWVGVLLTLSRSSLAALLVGLAVLAALRWKPSRALVVAVAVIAAGAVLVAATPRTFGLNQGINGASSGRGGLVSGGLSLFGDRPVYGWGSGSFVTEYRRHNRLIATTLSASHTIPITVGAEQGLIGEVAYLAMVIVILICLGRRSRGDPVRSAIVAAFAALVFHTLLYADFLEDPITWALLGVGVSLAVALPVTEPVRSTAIGSRAETGLAASS